MEEITDVDYMDRKRVCKDFKIEKLGEYHDLYLTSDTLLLQMFLKILEMCIEIYELDPAKFLSPPELAWHATLKKIKVKLDLLTDIDMLLMVEKAIRGICNAINRNAKTIKNYNEESDEGYFLEVDAQYPQKMYELHSDLPFLPERKKLKS